MFGLFKKKQQPAEVPVATPQYSEVDIAQFREEIANLSAQEPQDAAHFEQLGLLYAKVGEHDTAISHLEQSLNLKLSIGDGYKQLMSLYNDKRKAAAHQGNTEQIDYYMAKMDEMRNIAKQVTISRK